MTLQTEAIRHAILKDGFDDQLMKWQLQVIC